MTITPKQHRNGKWYLKFEDYNGPRKKKGGIAIQTKFTSGEIRHMASVACPAIYQKLNEITLYLPGYMTEKDTTQPINDGFEGTKEEVIEIMKEFKKKYPIFLKENKKHIQ